MSSPDWISVERQRARQLCHQVSSRASMVLVLVMGDIMLDSDCFGDVNSTKRSMRSIIEAMRINHNFFRKKISFIAVKCELAGHSSVF